VAQALDAEERARRSMSESLHDGALQDVLAAGHDLWALGDAPGSGGGAHDATRRRGPPARREGRELFDF